MACTDLRSELEKLADQIIELVDTFLIPNNAVIVYDIDNTLIDEFGRPLEPIIRTYNYIKLKGITPVIISSRTGIPEVIDYTIKQLHDIGIEGYKYLYLRPEDKYDVTRFKLMARKDIHDRGQYVIMSLGDQPWDYGKFGGMGIQIPTCNHSFRNAVNTKMLNFVDCSEV